MLPTIYASKSDPRFQDGRSVLLDDVYTELMVLQNKRPLTERVKGHADNFSVSASIKEIERALSAQGCEIALTYRRKKH
jgi:AMMECR1 domain-containing protein